jgi:PD-(D/E)XK nuclease superfamily
MSASSDFRFKLLDRSRCQISSRTQLPPLACMVNSTRYRPPFSYNIWADSEPAFGLEGFHCAMRRGFKRARNDEPEIRALRERDNSAQAIGHLAQQAVYEFYADPQLLDRSDGVKLVIDAIDLARYTAEIVATVTQILERYHAEPILKEKNILKLEPGDEEIPPPLVLKLQRQEFNFYAAMDCIYVEPDGTLHILDFKTGKSKFDKRQAFTYLLAAKYSYPERSVVASFYNLESQQQSKIITATPAQLQGVEMRVVKIAKQLADEVNRYRNNRSAFDLIFPPNPGTQCRYCPFSSVCEYTEYLEHNDIYAE